MKLSKSIETLIKAVLPTLGVVLLSVFAVPFGISKVAGIREEISQAEANQNTLTQKLATLTSIGDTASSQSEDVAIAVPEENPSLITLSQIRTLADDGGITISGIKGGGETKDKTGLSRVDITFDAMGGRPAILGFLSGISTISPITIVDKVKLTESGGAGLATVTISSFWAPFPTKLPAVTDPERDLTTDEKNTIAKVAGLKQPQFNEIPASETGGRSDPFTP